MSSNMLTEARNGSDIPSEVRDSEDRKRAGTAYIRDRLQREQKEAGRGYQAQILRQLREKAGHKVTNVHIANVINHPEKGAGIDLQMAFARLWDMTLDELQARGAPLVRQTEPVLGPELGELEAHLVLALELVRRVRERETSDATESVRQDIREIQEESATTRRRKTQDS